MVAVHGIDGLGHLGVQDARQMGFKTVALGRGGDKEPLAKRLGIAKTWRRARDSGDGTERPSTIGPASRANYTWGTRT